MSYAAADHREIRIPKTAEIVAARIRKVIVTGHWKTGDSLPAEAKLIEEYSVSRPIIREAIRILESEGLISVARGAKGGARVRLPDSSIVARASGLALQARGATMKDLYEGRMIIEPPAARLAAERRPAEAAAALGRHVDLEFKVISDGEAITKAIATFHRILVEHCGNTALEISALALQDVFERSLLASQQLRPPADQPDRQRRLRYGLNSHRKLVDLIAAKNGAEAEAHWTAHMENAGKVWLSDLGSKALVDILD